MEAWWSGVGVGRADGTSLSRKGRQERPTRAVVLAGRPVSRAVELPVDVVAVLDARLVLAKTQTRPAFTSGAGYSPYGTCRSTEQSPALKTPSKRFDQPSAREREKLGSSVTSSSVNTPSPPARTSVSLPSDHPLNSARSREVFITAEHRSISSRSFSRVEPFACRVARLMFLRLPSPC
ncbi:hypothetical protein NL676_023284 [Syzygium grande]|nr:hypothetical protein NL676_023284 [Syzygium grande]